MIRYTTDARYQYDISDACGPGGNGNCDGYEDFEYCECACHTANVPSIHTVKQVQRMHELYWATVTIAHATTMHHVTARAEYGF